LRPGNPGRGRAPRIAALAGRQAETPKPRFNRHTSILLQAKYFLVRQWNGRRGHVFYSYPIVNYRISKKFLILLYSKCYMGATRSATNIAHLNPVSPRGGVERTHEEVADIDQTRA